MSTMKPYATEADISAVPPGEFRRLNFGGGLYLLCLKSGRRYWQFRASVNGEPVAHSIGPLSKFDLEQARAQAAGIRALVADKRKELAVRAIEAKLTRVTTKKQAYPAEGFRSLDDAIDFVCGLHLQCSSQEVQMAIWQLLLVPAPPREMLQARWEEFEVRDSIATCWHPSLARRSSRKTPGRVTRSYYLSPRASAKLRQLRLLAPKDEMVFPSLSTKSYAEACVVLREALNKLWPQYALSPAEFRTFFVAEAKLHSSFKASFISDVAAGRLVPLVPRPTQIEAQALMEWWEAKVTQRVIF